MKGIRNRIIANIDKNKDFLPSLYFSGKTF